MEFKDVVGKITEIAPAIGAFFGAPGVAVGTAVKVLGNVFGLGDDAKPEDIVAALGSPDVQLKLVTAKQAYELEVLKETLKDVQDARKRQVEHEKATGKTDVNLYALAWLIVFGFFGLTVMLLYFSYQGKPIVDASGVLFMLLGTLSTAFGMVVGYFFGSSAGAAQFRSILTGQMKGK
jgi:hypothetical protein